MQNLEGPKNINILHLIDSGGLYGAESVLLNLAKEQQKMGHSPIIGSIRKKGIQEKVLEIEARHMGIEVCTFSMQPSFVFLGAKSILKFASNRNCDIIHSHGYKSNILLGFVPPIFRRIPIISTMHGWTSTGGLRKIRLYEWLDYMSLKFVEKVVLVNSGMLNNSNMIKFDASKIHVIDNGIEITEDPVACLDWEKMLQNVSSSERIKIESIKKFCSHGYVIISIGRLSPEKGFSDLIEAVHILVHEYKKDVRLLLIGEGGLRTKLEQQAEVCGLSGRFFITGYLKNAKQFLKVANVFVIASLTEGLPITLLEAMASFTPVVATAVGGIPNVVENGKEALLVPPKTPAAIAVAVNTLMQDGSLGRGLACLAERKVRRHYSCKAMAVKYIMLYNELLCIKSPDTPTWLED